MTRFADAEVDTRCKSRAEAMAFSNERLNETIERGRTNPLSHVVETTSNTTEVVLMIGTTGIPSARRGDVVGRTGGWGDMDPSSINPEAILALTRATTPTATTVSSIRELLRMYGRDERIRRLPPDRRALYERIVTRRDKAGPVMFDVVQELRELRKNA